MFLISLVTIIVGPIIKYFGILYGNKKILIQHSWEGSKK